MSGSVTSSGIRLGQGSQLTITEDDASAIAREVPAVQVAAPSTRGTTQVVYGNLNWSTVIQGVTGDYLEVAFDGPDGLMRGFTRVSVTGLDGERLAGRLAAPGRPVREAAR